MELNRAVAENIKRIRKSKKLSMERLAATCSPKQRRLIVAFIEMLLSQEYSD